MAKVTGPLMSMEASGTFGDTLTFRKRKGVNVVGVRSNPSNPQTTDQMHARAIFASVANTTKKVDKTETVFEFLRGGAPAGQTWNSYLGSLLIGAQAAQFEASKTAYGTGGNATVKGYFDDAAGQAGISPVDLDGTSNTQISAGLVLWNAYSALYNAGSTDTPALITSASEANVFAFTDALTGILPT